MNNLLKDHEQFDKSQRKEQLQLGFMRALAAQCGYTISDWSVDHDSVDFSIRAWNPSGDDALMGRRRPLIDVQLKCTAVKKYLKSDHISYPLEIKNYRDLIGAPQTPSYLFVMVVPEDYEQWVSTEPFHNGSFIAGACYWLKMNELQPVKNGTKIHVHLPYKNRVCHNALRSMMNMACLVDCKNA